MAKLAFTDFVGMNPDVAEKLLPSSFAVEATNVFTDQGVLNVYKASKPVTGTWNSKVGILSSLYLLGTRWLAWSENVSVARMQLENNADLQAAFTGLDQPRYTSFPLSASGGTNYPEVSYPLGIPAPTHAITASKSLKDSPANSVKVFWKTAGVVGDPVGDRIARRYVWTLVNSFGREGPPSPPSNIVYTNDDEIVSLTFTSQSLPVDISVDGKARVYVSATGGTFNFLKEFPISGLFDTAKQITDNTFGSALETELYSPPPTNLKGLVALANGFLAGYVGNSVHFSEPYQSHAWPEDYIKAMDYPVKGLAAIGNMLFVSTEGYPVVLVGNHPEFMTENKLGSIQANLSDRSIVDMGNGAMYASRDGIVLLTGGEATMISDGIISERVYQALAPSSIHAYFYRDKYVGFYNSGSSDKIQTETGEYIPGQGAFILDPKRRTVTFTDQTCNVAFSDKGTGKLFINKLESGVNNLYEFNEGSTNLPMVWRTRPTETPPMTFTVCRVDAKRYPLTFTLYTDDQLRHTQTVNNNRPFRLPSGYKARVFSAKIEGDSIVQGVFLATTVNEL